MCACLLLFHFRDTGDMKQITTQLFHVRVVLAPSLGKGILVQCTTMQIVDDVQEKKTSAVIC